MIEEKKLEDADSLWEELTNLQINSDPDDEIIYRGHSDARWGLIPTILRSRLIKKLELSFGSFFSSENQIWSEFEMLRNFIYFCDAAGTILPNDSVRLRERNLTEQISRNISPLFIIGLMKN